MIEKVAFPNNNGITLNGNYYRSGKDGVPGVIFSHGLFSSKDGYKITRMGESIADTGYDLLAFDFSYAGETGTNVSEISVLQEVEDLRCAVDFFKTRCPGKMHFLGSSMGAAVSILYVADNPHEALSLAGIATPADLRGLITGNSAIRDLSLLPKQGYTELQGIRMNNSFFHEIDGIDMKAALEKITVPVLAIHGDSDQVVPLCNVDILAARVKNFTSFIIENGDHNLVKDAEIRCIQERLLSWFSSINMKS